MRNSVRLVLIFLVSAFLTAGLLDMLGGGGSWRALSAIVAPPAKDDAGRGGASSRSAAARLLPATERLRQAQDEYLKILHDAPTDAAAFRGLVAVRRQMAGEEATVLRRQAAAYRQLIARGGGGPEGYSRENLERLESASLRAAEAIEKERSTAVHPGSMTTARTPAVTPADRPDAMVPRGSPGPMPGGAQVTTRGATLAGGPVPKQPGPPQTKTPPAGPAPATPPPQPPERPSPAGGSSSPQAPTASEPPASPAPSPAASEPPAPAPFPTGAQPPDGQPPTAGQPSPPASTGSSETVAVVSPPSAPSVTQSQGNLVSIDCQKRTFVLHDANGDEEYLAAANITIYVRGAKSERVPDICGLRGFIGRSAMAWSIRDGDRRIARWVSVVLSAPPGGS